MVYRTTLYTVMLFALVSTLAMLTQTARGADIEMEIFYLPHRPAEAVVAKVEQVAAEFNNVNLKKFSFADPGAEKLLKKYNLRDHMPVAIFINGKNNFIVNGNRMNLRNFPKGDPFVPMFAGEWDYKDLRLILTEISGEK